MAVFKAERAGGGWNGLSGAKIGKNGGCWNWHLLLRAYHLRVYHLRSYHMIELTIFEPTIRDLTICWLTIWEPTISELTILELTIWELTIWELTTWELTICEATILETTCYMPRNMFWQESVMFSCLFTSCQLFVNFSQLFVYFLSAVDFLAPRWRHSLKSKISILFTFKY